MKSFNQFCSEAIYFIEMSDFSAGGGNAKMRQTGMTRDQVIALGRKNLARLKNKPAAAAPKPAAPASTPAATSTRPPRPAATPVPRPKDERPTVGQVQAAEREAKYQTFARNLRLGKEIGADDMVKQMYRTQNSPAMQAHRAQMASKQEPWERHPHTLNKKVGRGYGVRPLNKELELNTTYQLADYYKKKYPEMSSNAAYKKAEGEAKQIHDRNRADYRSGSGYD